MYDSFDHFPNTLTIYKPPVSLRSKHLRGFGSKERPRNFIFGVFPTRKMGREPKYERGGRGGERRKETLADKPLDFKLNLRSLANRARDWLGLSNVIDMCRSKTF